MLRAFHARWTRICILAGITVVSGLTASAVQTSDAEANTAWKLIQARHTGLCLDVEGGSYWNGAKIVQWHCTGRHNQQFTFDSNFPHTVHYVQARHSGKVLDNGRSLSPGSPVHQWDKHDVSWQRWTFEAVGEGWYRVVNQYSGHCLDIERASLMAGARAVQWPCEGGAHNQHFRLLPAY